MQPFMFPPGVGGMNAQGGFDQSSMPYLLQQQMIQSMQYQQQHGPRGYHNNQ